LGWNWVGIEIELGLDWVGEDEVSAAWKRAKTAPWEEWCGLYGGGC